MDELKQWLEEVKEEAEGEMYEAAAEGYGAYYEIITTQGTGWEWAQKWWRPESIPAPYTRRASPVGTSSEGSTPGRVMSGYMRDSLDVNFGAGFAEVGFLSGFAMYFEDQELGFYNDEAEVHVDGMGAQASVHMVIDDSLERKGWRKRG